MGFDGEVGGASLISSSPLLSDLTHCCVQHTQTTGRMNINHLKGLLFSHSVGSSAFHAPMNAMSLINDWSSLYLQLLV